MITVLDNQAIAQYELATNPIVHPTSAATESIARLPVHPSTLHSGLAHLEGHLQALRTRTQHAPHIAHLSPLQRTEGRIMKARLRVIAGRHGLAIPTLQGLVETLQNGERSSVHEGHLLDRGAQYAQSFRCTAIGDNDNFM